MSMALLLTLLLPVLQDDPQVIYREGLFEEVDQGNLEKAAELYGKILKSGAPDALKAKALLRTGFCHEKKGKKKEAEQAWRDVVERFPGAAETAKLARERLAGLSQEGGAVSPSLESRIQALVLDLMSEEFNQQNGAVRKLVAIGQPAVPELRKAMMSKAHDLRGTAAYVLVQIGTFEGVYEGLRPLWVDDGRIGNWAGYALGETLKAREEDRKSFVKDVTPGVFARLFTTLFMAFGNNPDPAISKMVEDCLAEADYATFTYFKPWAANRDVAEIRRFAQRLATAKLHPNEKVREMLKGRTQFAKGLDAGDPKAADHELKQALLSALTGESDPEQLLNSIIAEHRAQFFHGWVFEYLTPREYVRGPISTWILRGPENIRSKVLYAIQSTVTIQPHATTEFAKELRLFQFDFINSPEHPLELRRRVFVSATFPDSPDLQKKFLQFCLQSLKEDEGDPEAEDRRVTATHWLLGHLPLDSKEMSETLQIASRGGLLTTQILDERKEVRAPTVAATIRALKDPQLSEAKVQRLLAILATAATPQEKATMGSLVILMKAETTSDAVRLYHEGIAELPEAEQEAAWKSYSETFEASPDHVKAVLADVLVGSEGKNVMDLMIKVSDSPNASARFAALRHWTQFPQIPLKTRTWLLLKGLKDSTEENQLQAVVGLTVYPDLDAVPDIIEALNSTFAKVRTEARKALDEIKKHYEAQAEWKRWYDETKKALKK